MNQNKQTINDFCKKYSWENQMNASKGLDSWDNYGGPSLGGLVVVPGIGRNRDSEIMDESNFETALEMLGGESETVEVQRFGHWGCGWFEIITIDPKDLKAIKIAMDIQKSLEHYPLLDDTDYYEREHEYHADFAKAHQEDTARAICKHLGLEELSETPEMIYLTYHLNIECQRYYGSDSCINIYANREPEDRDWEHLITSLKQLYGFEFNEAYQLLCACFDVGDI